MPVHKDDWKFLGTKFVDTVLHMGCATPCSIFQPITRAICSVMESCFPSVKTFGYLDDFSIVSGDEVTAKNMSKVSGYYAYNLGFRCQNTRP